MDHTVLHVRTTVTLHLQVAVAVSKFASATCSVERDLALYRCTMVHRPKPMYTLPGASQLL